MALKDIAVESLVGRTMTHVSSGRIAMAIGVAVVGLYLSVKTISLAVDHTGDRFMVEAMFAASILAIAIIVATVFVGLHVVMGV